MSSYDQQRAMSAASEGLVLQKQLPSSQVPRFNPHGRQPAPKEKKPEYKGKPYSPIKISRGKAAGLAEVRKNEQENMNIEELLIQAGAEFRNPDKIPGGWLPLDAYDDWEYDTRRPEDWLRKGGKGPILKEGVEAHGLWQDKDKMCYWRKIRIFKYLPKSQRYEGCWEITKIKCRLARIFILFDEEDASVFVRRFRAAYQSRIHADALIKYNYYIENMPKHQIPEIDGQEVNRILSKTQNTKALRGKSSADTTTLLNEVNNDFAKTMNNIIFDKHLYEKGNNLITGPLNLPARKEKKIAPFFGMISIPQSKKSFSKIFSKLSFKALIAKDEVIRAQQDIRKECNDVAEKDIFAPNIVKTQTVDEFNQIQTSSTQQTSFYLKETWVNKLKEIIKNNHSDQGQAGAWFNLAETNKEVFENSRLKKFLIQNRFIMQETVLNLTQKSVKRFVDSITWFLPMSTEIKSSNLVENIYYTPEEIKAMGAAKDKFPLFKVEIQLDENNQVQFNNDPEQVTDTILQIFEQGLLALQEIPLLEQKLMPHLYKANQKMYLKVPVKPKEKPEEPDPANKKLLPDENTWVYDEFMRLRGRITESILPLREYLDTFNKYQHEYDLDPNAEIQKLQDQVQEGTVDTRELQKLVVQHRADAARLSEEVPEGMTVSMFKVSSKGIRDIVADKHKKIANQIIEIIAQSAKTQAEVTMKAFEAVNSKVESQPKSIEELSQIRDFMENVPNEIKKLQNEIIAGMNIYKILESFQYQFKDEDDYDRQWHLFGSPGDTLEKIEKNKHTLDKAQDQFVGNMIHEQREFEHKNTELQNQVAMFDQYTEIESFEEVAIAARELKRKLDEATDKAKQFNNREALTGNEETSYEHIKQMMNDFLPFYELWTTTDVWNQTYKNWMSDDFTTIDPQFMEELVEESFRQLNKNIKFFRQRDLGKIHKIAEIMKDKVGEFQPHVPMTCAMLTTGIKDRHWDKISEIVGQQIKPYEGFTLQHILKMDLLKYSDAVVDVGDRASKEYQIETSLKKMKNDWMDQEFTTKPYKTSGSCTVLGFDDAQAIQDEQIILTQAMQFSSFKQPFEEEIEEWNATLLNVSNVIEEWIRCQQAWAYLQPIFDSQDIQRQLPGDSKKFKRVNKMWTDIIDTTKANPNVLAACSQEMKDGLTLLDAFKRMNNDLDKVQKGLKDYLEEKCAVFARFYFLSQDDLLQILSQTKEVRNVRPHLKKVFENMADLEFQPDLTITAMMSGEKEKIMFDSPVNPKDKKVEDWMCEVEDMMFASVRSVLKKSIIHYEQVPRPDWILVHPGMCILNGSQVHWTKNFEEALNKDGTKGVQEFLQLLETDLLQTVELVRRDISTLQRITLGALIVLDVHAKDVIKTLVDEKIGDVHSFEWISQLRYYWVQENCRVRCIQTDFPYGYEYLGNTGRLVITPLTDKCYMTLMGALKLNLGGAPAGPAGTGKTESTKDLAKALAKQCVVFNCSDGMDHLMIAKFFKGLSAAGAWCCFDEFNRINVEVLSVIAQQLLELFGAKAEERSEIFFSGSHIKMKPTFCVFITMNPGYAGRTELPDNLKALFRPVAMMVPNYGLIAKIMLYSFGYESAGELSLKITNVFTLSSEQLSSQDHYDYGMRAVRSVINAAGLLKAAHVNDPEDQLILRAIRDVNVPKFLKDDLPLFENIISDLFPGVEPPKIDRGILLEAVKNQCHLMHIQPIPAFVEKVFQLYDTTTVRHGLMIVGPTGGGKTCCYNALQKAQTQLHGKQNFKKTNVHILNPKSITMNQLYGALDPSSGEWVDGIAAKIIGKAASDETDDKHWVMFDGPVDALWIESMNTVLDDNKKLCLNSGQIIPLSAHMTMMFEVEDLAVASPATVSRCGMVYMEPGSIGITPLVDSWLETIPEPLRVLRPNQTVKLLKKLFDTYLEPMIKFMRKNCSEPVPTVNNNISQSCMRILDCYFSSYKDTDAKKIQEAEVENLEEMMEPIFVFAIIWSIGCTTTSEGRNKFSEKLREIMGKDNPNRIPQEGTVYEYVYLKDSKEWTKWNEIEGKFVIDVKASFAEIIVPTFDSIRMKYIKKMLVTNGKNVLCPGPTGTGKTVNITDMLNQQLTEEYQTIPMTFSAQTGANQTQDALDERMEKRRKGVYGPTTGKKFCIFIDDLNMPKKEEYGAQPPIELIRQWMDHQGWYDRHTKEKEMRKIVDIVFISAMGFPGGGRAFLTQRLERHYNIITYTNLGEESTLMIFKTITMKFLGSFEEEIQKSVEKLCLATQNVYKGVELKLKPTPTKSHYTFNLRDMSKIFQGVCSAHKQTVVNKVDLLRLWMHENVRVFGDRMISDADKKVLTDLIFQQTEQQFQTNEQTILDRERIIFGDYINGIEGENRPYQIVNDLKVMVHKIETYLDDYNTGTKHPMKLVMFLDACDHVSRICRVLRQPLGNALLLGVGGSGRQSLSKLATYMQSYKIYQIEVIKGYSMRDWRDNLRFVLMQAGVELKPTSFLFVDTQIINEQMLEDINGVLNSGDVPALYKAEDMEPILAEGKKECVKKQLTVNKMNMFQCYLNRVKQNIHMVIAMSPLGEVFRTRLRMFPSLVNCCTLDWFTNWPSEALLNVGTGFVNDNELDLQNDANNCIEMFKVIHQSVEDTVIEFREVHRRISYVTPTSFLELLSMYKKVLESQRKQNNFAISRLSKGLDVLAGAQIEVDNMQKQLEESQPILERTQIEVEQKKVVIAEQTVIANEQEAIVSVETAEAQKVEAHVRGIKDQAQAKLDEALPALEKAVAAVKKIDVNSFYELKAVQKPKPSIVMCFKLVCWFIRPNSKPTKPNKPEDREYDAEGYFFDITKNDLLKEPKKFLQELIEYDKDNIPDELINKVKPFMDDPLMESKKIEGVAKSLVPVKIWIEAMINYHATLKIVNPMRETARVRGEELAVVQADLAKKQAALDKIRQEVADLNEEQENLVKKAAQLEHDLEECKKKLVRADKMISGLAGEKDRWTETVKRLTIEKDFIIGNSLVAAGMVSYAGPFISQYRESLENSWRLKMTELGIQYTEGVTMRQVLGHDVTIRQWGVAGLPSDNLSIQNGIIMFGSRRWPLMIDPQTQAKKFIKRLGETTPDVKLNVCKMSDNGLIRQLELSIQFGQWVLIENIGEELDPALEPVLLQQKVKQGSGWEIKLGERQIPYNDNFKFYMTTTLPNPHYSPETSVKVSILNFSITPVGLEEQMLNLLVLLELPELQRKKDEIVEENARSAKILYDGEDNLLQALSANTVAELLNTDDLINTLAETQKTSAEITERQAQSKITEKEIDVTRESFRPVAFRAQLLFFAIVDLNIIDPMYQYSLQWFQKLFESSVRNSEQTAEVEPRIKILNDYFTKSLYQNVCRSLFEMHKLLFSFLLCTKILFGQNGIDQKEWRFFLAGPSGQIEEVPNPTNWLDDLEWQQTYKQLYTMERTLPIFEGILEYFTNFNVKFKKIFDSVNAHEEPMPGEWNTRLNSFQKMILLKTIRADKIPLAIQNYVIEKMSEDFVKPPTFKLSECFMDSSNTTPLVFVLSSGSDPMAQFLKYVDECGMRERYKQISLGSGQDKAAEEMIEQGKQQGQWILLANCHLMISWMPKLEAIVEQLNSSIHQEFRLWLTSAQTPKFPVSILQNSVKMTMEPPAGLRANMLQTYDSFDNKQLNDCKYPSAYKKLIFAFSFFHAICQDRRKFGPIGWNIRYEFSNEDFAVCSRQLKIFLDEAATEEAIPFKVLQFLGAEINYGGRVTDDKDVRLIINIIKRFVNKDTLTDGYKLSKSGKYYSMKAGSHEDYVKYINNFDINPHPEAFGLHENAEITTNQNETRIILENLLSIQPRQTSAGEKSREEIIGEISASIEEKTPSPFDVEEVAQRYPTDYNESMNTVLTQELVRYSRMLALMREMLANVQLALKGEVVMSEDLDKMANSLYNNQVPQAWQPTLGFLSLKPLASWINELNDRVSFLQKWIDNGSPATFWISGFFFPQAFFTGTLQNFARKKKIAIDQLSFDFRVFDDQAPQSVTEKPEDGALCYGMYMEGARWNPQTHLLDDSNPMQLYTEFPMVWFLPKHNRKKPETGVYNCPLYKVLSRAGTLSTTGHSTNYCMLVEIPTKEDEEVWIRSGVALFLSLRY